MLMSYNQILPYLIHKWWVTPKALRPMIPLYPPNFDENSIYGYHDESLGHTTKNCKALKQKVQELIDAKLLTFKELGPNVYNNPFPRHPHPSVNALENMNEEVPNLVFHCLLDDILNNQKTEEIQDFPFKAIYYFKIL